MGASQYRFFVLYEGDSNLLVDAIINGGDREQRQSKNSS
jgi:hypothetical protein